VLTRAELDDIAEQAATRALARVGLHDDDAGEDVRDLRRLLDSWKTVKRGALSAAGKGVVTIFLAGFAAYAGIKLKLFGG
jgi:hypothetical protein